MGDPGTGQAQQLSNTFSPFDLNETTGDVRSNQQETVTKGLFAGNTGSLTAMYTSSNLTTTQKTYYQEIYSTGDPDGDVNAKVECSFAYGHFAGSGSLDTTGNLNNDTPSRAIYKQYAQVLLEPTDLKFTFNGTDSDSCYFINFNRTRLREKLDEGNFEITLAMLSGSIAGNVGNDSHTGSHVRPSETGEFVQIVDDSSTTAATVGPSGKVYNLVSGSIDGGISIFKGNAGTSNPTYFGLLYPQVGVAVLDATQLDKLVADGGANFDTTTGSLIQGDNAIKLFTSVATGSSMVPSTMSGGIQARSSEQVKSSYFFVRIKNGQYNYSNNPSFVTGSAGALRYTTFINDPQTYITTIGLYNQSHDLLAVAKLSQPLLKSFTREALIRVKLDF
ncbi:hypothetical protein CMI37_18780 [Candidatus Pacearchaeota archaeon]|nr:hypothetical protein [Candidatus Pacearchaeota archaeon]